MKIAVITSNIGNYEDKVVPCGKQSVEYDYHYFNDENFSLRPSLTPHLQARIPKVFGWQLAPGYDYYIYVDSSCTLLHEEAVAWFVSNCEGVDCCFFLHPVRNTIQEEADYLTLRLSLGCRYVTPRYKNEFIDEQLKAIYADKEFVDQYLLSATAFVYNDNERVRDMMTQWWHHMSRFHINDQLSLPYVVWKAGCSFKVLPSERGHYAVKSPYLSRVRGKPL